MKLCFRDANQECKPPDEVARLLRDPKIEIVFAGPTPGGQQGAYLLNLKHGRKDRLRAKWRTLDAKTFLANLGSPHRETVAYHLQKLFLDPLDYVVPPTVPHCFSLREYRKKVDPLAEPTWPDIPCVFGYLSYWLPGVETVAHHEKGSTFRTDLFAEERFRTDDDYARTVAALNLVTYTVKHGDSHASQFVVTDDPFHVWSIDHSVSLTALKNPLVLFKEDWSFLHVPELPRDLAARIAGLDRSDVERLQVVESLNLRNARNHETAHASHRKSAKSGEPGEPGQSGEQGEPGAPGEPGKSGAPKTKDAVMTRNGDWVHVGTNERERTLIWTRISELKRELREGRLRISDRATH